MGTFNVKVSKGTHLDTVCDFSLGERKEGKTGDLILSGKGLCYI